MPTARKFAFTPSCLCCSLVICLLVLSSPAWSEDCFKVRLSPGQFAQANENLRAPEHCDAEQIFYCPGGVVVTTSTKPMGGYKIVGGKCYRPGSAALNAATVGRRILTPKVASGAIAGADEMPTPGQTRKNAVGQKPLFANPQAEARTRTAVLAHGVPAVIFERALDNYRQRRAAGETSRPCFMAADMTTPDQGVLWQICLQPKVSVLQMPTYYGTGLGPTCENHPYRNNYRSCARYFGNKKNFCLTAGGNYLTTNVTQSSGSQRPFVELKGFDTDENDNTAERSVGIHQTLLHDGKNYVGQIDRSRYSNGSLTLPVTGDRIDPVELSFAGRDGGMALYVYPSRQDILDFRTNGKAAYWNPTCAGQIGSPGWIGSKDQAAPTLEEASLDALTPDQVKPQSPDPEPELESGKR